MLSVADARAALLESRSKAASKGDEVEVWLGSKYERLLESADAIVSLASAAEDVRDFVASLDDKLEAALDKKEEEFSVVAEEKEESSAAARLVKMAPLLWRCLDRDEYGEASRLFAECCSLELSEPERATLEPYARQFGSRISKGALVFLSKAPRETRPSRHYADALQAVECSDPLSLFMEKRAEWVRGACFSKDLELAARYLRRTVIDAHFIFGDEDEGELSRLRSAASRWTRSAAEIVRSTATASLSKLAETPTDLAAVVASVRAECDAESEEWLSACETLFVAEEERRDNFREKLGLKTTARRKKAVVFPPAVDGGTHARLLQAARKGIAEKDDDEDSDRCSLWRSIFAPTLLALVEERLRRGLEATRFDAMTMIEAVEKAAGGVQSECSSAEINWTGERISTWVDERLAGLSRDALALAEKVLKEDDDSTFVKTVVERHVAPRFAEELGCFGSQLRRKAEAMAKTLEELRRAENARVDEWSLSLGAKRLKFYGESDSLRLRVIARAKGAAALAAERRASSIGLLVVARIAWGIAYAGNRTARRLAALCRGGGPHDDNPMSLMDARAVVDRQQLRAAFDIADVDGDGVVSARQAAQAAQAVCVGALLEAKAKRFIDPDLLEASAATLTFDELVLMATGALDAQGRDATETTALDCFNRAHATALQCWAREVGGALLDNLLDELVMDASDWSSAAAAKMKAIARWRDRKIVSEDFEEVVPLPCEPTRPLAAFLLAAAVELDRATCASDYALCKHDTSADAKGEETILLESPSGEIARRELLRVIGPGLVAAFDDAVQASTGELAPLSYAIDAFMLRFAFRRAALRDALDDSLCGSYKTSGIQIFRQFEDKIDPVDLELYRPFLKADAQRAYLRSSLFFDNLFGYDDDDDDDSDDKKVTAVDHQKQFDDDFKRDRDDMMPPDDFFERPSDLLSGGLPLSLRLPLVPEEPKMPEDLTPGSPEYEEEYGRQVEELMKKTTNP